MRHPDSAKQSQDGSPRPASASIPDPAVSRPSLWLRRPVRLTILVALLLLTLAYLVTQRERLLDDFSWVDDYVEYWAAARLNMTGGNPYGADELMALQLAVGWDEAKPLMMWNPPPTLALLMPFALLDYGPARMLWLAANVVIVMVAATLLWRLYAGSMRAAWLGVLLSCCFAPTLFVLRLGQIGPWVLLGVTGFLWMAHRQRWMAAGAFLVLTLIKPHIVLLLWATLGLWWLRRRNWWLVGGALLALGLAWLVATAMNPQVNTQYLTALRDAPPLYWRTTTLGALLRVGLGWVHEWLQFVPSLVALAWFLPWWLRREPVTDWRVHTPLLLLVSATFAAFGWVFDFVVLLPAVIQAATWLVARPARGPILVAVTGFVLIQAIAFAQNQAGLDMLYFVWMAPTLLALYLYLWRAVGDGNPVGFDSPSATG